MAEGPNLTGVMLDGRYRLTRLMGQGGMGQVYAGIHEFLDRPVAVKVLLPRLACEAKFRERFLREAKAASKILHRNVVKILDFGQTPNDSVYFVMEMLEGNDLKALLRQTGPLPWPRARHMLLQILAALQAAHRQRIIHRDIKPANCFLVATSDDQERIKLLDFGIAKVTVDPEDQSNSLAESLTGTGEVFGSVKYIAPEQATGFSNDPRVDLYSVGILAYEMLTGQVPFDGPFAFHVVAKHLNELPRPPRELNPQIPPPVEAVILRALAKHPDHRFGSAKQMRNALAAIPKTADASTTVRMTVPPAESATGATASSGQTVRSAEAWPAGTEQFPGAPTHVTATSGGKPAATTRQRAPVAVIVVLLGLFGCVILGIAWQLTSTSEDVGAQRAEVELSPMSMKGNSARPPPSSDLADASPPNIEMQPTNPQPMDATAEPPQIASSEDPADTTETGPSSLPPPEPQPPSRTSNKKRLTDARVRTRMRRSIEKRCRSLGQGTHLTIDVVIGADGHVLSKVVKGASGALKQCILRETDNARFPKGRTRRVTIQASP
ncbi:MAG: protein kinase [Myxococcota bacterium]